VLAQGDSLASVAFGEFGDATLWRALARLNGIDDPMAIAPGTRILVPSAAEARLLNAAED
jgi:nucleoid-associated protein YgaU